MAIFNRWSLTKAAKKMIAEAQANRSTISFTKARVGDGIWENKDDMRFATGLKSEKQEFEFSGIDIPDGNTATVVLEVTMNNRGLNELYYITELGVFAKDSAGEEHLYCILTSDKKNVYMPANNGLGVSTIVERINLEVADAANANVETDGGLVSATDFIEVKKILKQIESALSGGEKGQHIVKTEAGKFSFEWLTFMPVVTDKFSKFPKTGEKNTLYVDTDSSELYVWLNERYFKLPLGAEAPTTLQKQITENRENMEQLEKRVEKTELILEYKKIRVKADEWTKTQHEEIDVYQNEIKVDGITEDTWLQVWTDTIAETVEEIVKEQEAQAIFFGRGKAYADDGKLILKCFKRVPVSDFGIQLQGVKE